MALLDSTNFPALYHSLHRAGDRDDLTGHIDHNDPNHHTCGLDQPVVELLLSQVTINPKP